MSNVATQPAPRKRRRWGRVFFNWWSLDADELQEGVADYHKSLTQARHIAAYVWLLGAAYTGWMVYSSGATAADAVDASGYLDVGLMLLFAAFTFLGHRWAMIAAMLYWTISEVLHFVAMVQDDQQYGTHGSIIPILAFWAVGMAPMWRAFLIERAWRRASRSVVPA